MRGGEGREGPVPRLPFPEYFSLEPPVHGSGVVLLVHVLADYDLLTLMAYSSITVPPPAPGRRRGYYPHSGLVVNWCWYIADYWV